MLIDKEIRSVLEAANTDAEAAQGIAELVRLYKYNPYNIRSTILPVIKDINKKRLLSFLTGERDEPGLLNVDNICKLVIELIRMDGENLQGFDYYKDFLAENVKSPINEIAMLFKGNKEHYNKIVRFLRKSFAAGEKLNDIIQKLYNMGEAKVAYVLEGMVEDESDIFNKVLEILNQNHPLPNHAYFFRGICDGTGKGWYSFIKGARRYIPNFFSRLWKLVWFLSKPGEEIPDEKDLEAIDIKTLGDYLKILLNRLPTIIVIEKEAQFEPPTDPLPNVVMDTLSVDLTQDVNAALPPDNTLDTYSYANDFHRDLGPAIDNWNMYNTGFDLGTSFTGGF